MEIRYYVIFAVIGVIVLFPVVSIVFYGAVPVGINYKYFENCEECELYGCADNEIYDHGMCITPETKQRAESIAEIDESEIPKPSVVKADFDLSQITSMKPNTAEFFYYPDIPIQDRKDTYKLFMIIRLPEWMGGSANDTSAFRAYSAKALDDACVVKYWPDDGRQRIENPCQGGMYRIIDGAMIAGLIPRSTLMTALPHLDLSIDENGILYIEPPKWTKTKNGVIGYGREISFDEFRENSEFLVDAFAKSRPEYPQIPIEFAGYLLSDISAEQYMATVSYTNYPDNSERILVTIGKTPGKVGFVYYPQENYEIWKVGDTTIRIEGSALDENSSLREQYRTYVVKFKDDFHYRIEGKNIDAIKNEIMRVYFPEHDKDDLILISKERK